MYYLLTSTTNRALQVQRTQRPDGEATSQAGGLAALASVQLRRQQRAAVDPGAHAGGDIYRLRQELDRRAEPQRQAQGARAITFAAISNVWGAI